MRRTVTHSAGMGIFAGLGVAAPAVLPISVHSKAARKRKRP